jgi:hypothetical protein
VNGRDYGRNDEGTRRALGNYLRSASEPFLEAPKPGVCTREVDEVLGSAIRLIVTCFANWPRLQAIAERDNLISAAVDTRLEIQELGESFHYYLYILRDQIQHTS